jgi:hypothetical protein
MRSTSSLPVSSRSAELPLDERLERGTIFQDPAHGPLSEPYFGYEPELLPSVTFIEDVMRVIDAAIAGPSQRAREPLVPRIDSCDTRVRTILVTAYREAHRWALAARRWLAQLGSSRNLRERWNGSSAARLFGPYRTSRFQRVLRVFDELIRRFHRGYQISGRWIAPALVCFPMSYSRCRKGLLGNASIFGTVRLCPQLLERGPAQTASVVLHELMHQGLGVDDQRHQACNGSKHRCYREGAQELVNANRFDLAVRNIDNYVAFARLLAGRT